MKNIYLVRHAQSISNAGLPTDHPKTVSLTELGKKQAQELADNRENKPDLIVYSTYDRTYQTAEPLIKKFPDVKTVQLGCIHEFTYLDAEKYKGTTGMQRATGREKFWDTPNIYYKDSPTSESIYDLFTRVDQAIDYLRSLYGKEVAVFSHGQFIYTLMKALQDPRFMMQKNIKKYLYTYSVEQDHGILNASIHNITHLLQK